MSVFKLFQDSFLEIYSGILRQGGQIVPFFLCFCKLETMFNAKCMHTVFLTQFQYVRVILTVWHRSQSDLNHLKTSTTHIYYLTISIMRPRDTPIHGLSVITHLSR